MTFEEFVTDRLPASLRFAAVLTGDRASAEDIIQEVLARAYQRWDKISSMDHPELYIRRMIVNEYASSRRKLWRLVPSGRGGDFDDRIVPDHANHQADRDALLAELTRLPRRQRAALVLRYYEELSDGEIAEVLGCTPVTIRSYISRALAALRVEMSGRQQAVAPSQEKTS